MASFVIEHFEWGDFSASFNKHFHFNYFRRQEVKDELQKSSSALSQFLQSCLSRDRFLNKSSGQQTCPTELFTILLRPMRIHNNMLNPGLRSRSRKEPHVFGLLELEPLQNKIYS